MSLAVLVVCFRRPDVYRPAIPLAAQAAMTIRASIYVRLRADPITRKTKTGNTMTAASVPVDVGRAGKEPATEWIGLLALGATAEALASTPKATSSPRPGTMTRSNFTDRNGN